MKQPEEGPSGDKLGDNAEIGGLCTGPHEQHYIGVLQPLHDAHFSPELLQQGVTRVGKQGQGIFAPVKLDVESMVEFMWALIMCHHVEPLRTLFSPNL